MNKNTTIRIVLGILTVLVSVVLIIYLAPRLSSIHELRSLKWFPILTAFIGFYIAGLTTKELNIKQLALLLLALLIFIPVRYFYFPLILYLFFTAIWALVLSRAEVRRGVKRMLSVIGIVVFTSLLFKQPLIIKKKGFKKEIDGTLLNAKVIWDFDDNEIKTLTDEVFTNVDEEEVFWSDFQDKIIYVSFWATWCGPCIAEKPLLEKLKQDLKENDAVVFVDISLDRNKANWKSFLEKYKPGGVQLVSDSESVTRRNFEFLGTPHHVVVNRSGQYKSLRDIPSAKEYLENEEMLNNWIQQGRVVVEKVK